MKTNINTIVSGLLIASLLTAACGCISASANSEPNETHKSTLPPTVEPRIAVIIPAQDSKFVEAPFSLELAPGWSQVEPFLTDSTGTVTVADWALFNFGNRRLEAVFGSISKEFDPFEDPVAEPTDELWETEQTRGSVRVRISLLYQTMGELEGQAVLTIKWTNGTYGLLGTTYTPSQAPTEEELKSIEEMLFSIRVGSLGSKRR